MQVILKKWKTKKNFWAYTRFFYYSLGATPIGSAGHAPYEDGNIGYDRRVKNWLHHRWQTPDNKFDISLPSGGICDKLRRQPNDFGHGNSQTRLTIKFWCSSHIRRDKMLECYGCKDHEGKTSGSVLHGLACAHECALLVSLCIHNTKKILVDALGTLRNTEIHAFVSPNCGKKLGYAKYRIWVPRLEFKVGSKFLPM
jgi:hypothetical protein